MKYNKIFCTLASAIVLALLIMAVPAVPAHAAAEDIDLYPSKGEVGEEVDIYGYNFELDETIYIYFSSDHHSTGYDIEDLDAYERVETTSSDDGGEFDTYFDVPDELTKGDDAPEDVHGGTYYVYASYSRYGDIEAVADFTVIGGEITISPEKSTVGDRVEISGEDFGNRKSITVEYDGVEVDIASGDTKTNSSGDFTCIIVIPESVEGDHTITVTDTSDIEAEADFTVEPEITISPTSGAIGDAITVNGTGFSYRKNITIYFNNVTVTLTSGTARTDTYGSFDNLKFNVPAVGPAAYYVEAKDTANKTATAKFTIAAAASFSLTSGYVGTKVTVSGAGFMPTKNMTIYFAGAKVTTSPASIVTDIKGSFTGSFLVPSCAIGTYKLEVSDGTNKDSTNFTVITEASLSNNSGNVGAELTVSGTGFSGTVSIKYDDIEVTTAAVKADGTFLATFNVPASIGGDHVITVSDAYNTKQFTFTMESTSPPIPVPLLPEVDSKAKPQAHFDWEDVTDPSLPVTHTLHIASDADFTTRVLEKEGLADSEYTIPKEERLESTKKEAPYYWHVKAIDGASNESGWSGTGSFYVGFAFTMPQWALYTLFGVGGLLLLALAFWLGRRTAYSSF